jgi:hypothetical protein
VGIGVQDSRQTQFIRYIHLRFWKKITRKFLVSNRAILFIKTQNVQPYHHRKLHGAYSQHSLVYTALILLTIQALQQDFNAVYFSKATAGGKKLPWTLPSRLPYSDKTISKTLYSQSYLSVTVDEAHSFRNNGPRHSSILLLLEKAELRLILTATPLQTSTKVGSGSTSS